MGRYRKKPVVIEAWKVSDLLHTARHALETLPPAIEEAHALGALLLRSRAIDVSTLEGMHTGDYDDMIIQGVKGELYPCKPDIFELTYEQVDD